MQAYAAIEKEGKEKRIKLIHNLHLDPAHKAFMLFEAPNAETLRDCLVHCGFLGFLDLSFYLVTPVAELLENASDFPIRYP